MKREKRGLLIICGESVEINGGCSLTRLVFFDMMKKYSNMSITYHKKKKKRSRTHGFRKRSRSRGGKRTLNRRRNKKRRQITV